MKNLLNSILLVGFMLISASFMSKDKDFSLSIASTNSTTLNFEVLNAENISLSIYSDKNGELFSEKLGTVNTVFKSYDLKTLDMGTYYLVAESDQKVEKYKISIDYLNNVTIDKKPVSQIKKPTYSVDGNRVKLSVQNMKTPAIVSITDFSGIVYYSETKKSDDGNLDLTFELNPFAAEKYIITVEEDGNIFNKIIALK